MTELVFILDRSDRAGTALNYQILDDVVRAVRRGGEIKETWKSPIERYRREGNLRR